MSTVTVTGMTCGCRADSVRDEIGRGPGVAIESGSGVLPVDNAAPVECGDRTAAPAGYPVAD